MVPRALPSRAPLAPLSALPVRRAAVRRAAASAASGSSGPGSSGAKSSVKSAKAAPATKPSAKKSTANTAPGARRASELRAMQSLPIHPDPFQRSQYHEVRMEAAVVGAAALATVWYFFVRPLGKLYRPGESGPARPALSSLLGKAMGMSGMATRVGARATQPLEPAQPARPRTAPPPPPPPPPPRAPRVGAPGPPMSDSLAQMLAEAQQLEARMDAEVARLAAEEAARKAATDAEVAAYAAALKQPAPRPARVDRDRMDMAFPIKVAVAVTELVPELSNRLEAAGIEGATGTAVKFAQQAGQAAAKTFDSAIKAGGEAVAAATKREE